GGRVAGPLGGLGRRRAGSLPYDPPVDGALWPGRHRQRPRWNVLPDDRAGPRVGAVADAHRGDEHRVRSGPDVRTDGRPVLGHTVVVDEDRRGADVALLADRGV